MAGNTKLMGFTPEGKVQLERWGGKTIVAVSVDSLSALRKACYMELPKKPKQRRRDDLNGCNISYDEHVGRVHVDMDTESAAQLAGYLRNSDCGESDELLRKALDWADDLTKAVQAHHDYHNKDGEPGVQDEEMES